jgi:hypothetical protein
MGKDPTLAGSFCVGIWVCGGGLVLRMGCPGLVGGRAESKARGGSFGSLRLLRMTALKKSKSKSKSNCKGGPCGFWLLWFPTLRT